MSNPVAIVTGAGKGLGKFLSHKLSQGGYDIFYHYHSSRPSDVSESDMCQADLSRESGALETITNCIKRFGRIDVLVNNAGVYHEKSLMDLSQEEWCEGINTTASACFFTTRAALPHLRKSPIGGRVINIGDSSCERLTKRDLSISYHIGKTGVLLLTKSFAATEMAHGLTVNMVSPGMLENSVGKPPVSTMPAGRYGEFSDVWNVVEFLLSPQSAHITGSNILSGGGWNL